MRWRRLLVALSGLAVAAVACGGGTGSGPTTATSEAASTARAAAQTTQASAPADGSESFGRIEGTTFTLATGWTGVAVGEGIKPVLALAPDDTPGIAYLLEDLEGFVVYADAGSGWQPQTVVEGYFYGPIGLTYTPDAAPHIAYHDHQADSFIQELGDLTVAHREDGTWVIEAIENPGHDGWDSTIVTGADGMIRAAGIDPQQFDREDGVEYYELTDTGWEVTAIGSGPVAYEYNVALAVQPNGEPALTYYDNNQQDLMYAFRENGTWSIETVDAAGDVGRYSSLTFDPAGTAHISYIELTGATTGTVRYATGGPGQWSIESVTALDSILTGFTGARRITDIAIDSADQPHIVFGDEQIVGRAWRDGAAWITETVVEAGDLRLGQLVSFELAGDDTAHIAVFEVTRANPLRGVVAYLTTK